MKTGTSLKVLSLSLLVALFAAIISGKAIARQLAKYATFDTQFEVFIKQGEQGEIHWTYVIRCPYIGQEIITGKSESIEVFNRKDRIISIRDQPDFGTYAIQYPHRYGFNPDICR